MINDTTPDLTRDDDQTTSEETPEQIEVEHKGFSLGKSIRSPRTLISFALAIGIILFVFHGFNIDLSRTWEYMRAADLRFLLIALLVFYLTFPLRAIRWRMLLDNAGVPVRHGHTTWASLPALIEYIYLSWFAN